MELGRTVFADYVEEIHFISSFSISKLDKRSKIWYT